MSVRPFPLGAVLTCIGEKLVCDIGEVYKLLSFMIGRSVYTHELPSAMRRAKPHILAQHPQLGSVDDTAVNAKNWREWRAAHIATFGPTLDLTPLPLDDALGIVDKSPIDTLRDLVPDEKIIALDTRGDV